jgi:hypothetical protein
VRPRLSPGVPWSRCSGYGMAWYATGQVGPVLRSESVNRVQALAVGPSDAPRGLAKVASPYFSRPS